MGVGKANWGKGTAQAKATARAKARRAPLWENERLLLSRVESRHVRREAVADGGREEAWSLSGEDGQGLGKRS